MTTAREIEALERRLLDPGLRSDGDQVADLLAERFVEFGSSGRKWTKATTIAHLAGAAPSSAEPAAISDLNVDLLAEGAALVTYRIGEANHASLRSSVWIRETGGWKMVFHQGTPCRIEEIAEAAK